MQLNSSGQDEYYDPADFLAATNEF